MFSKPPGAKKVVGDPSKDSEMGNELVLMDLLFSDSDDEVKTIIRVRDEGSEMCTSVSARCSCIWNSGHCSRHNNYWGKTFP